MKYNFNRLIFLLIIISMLNEISALRCFKCDSTRDENCAIDPEHPDLKFAACESLLSKCAMSVVGLITYRGCSDEIHKGEYYRECDKDLCNDKIWPPGRLKCFQCDGKECIQEQKAKSKPCVRFLEEDTCFTDIINKEYAIRGCISDNKTLTANVKKCAYNSCNYEIAMLTL
ncbi:uncharacterized protein LOC129608534 [Condylostylus longicornis]|uniref:uncharacterized protein LOC129608534 n=1 Tax=Condylostylus longicornis TaxID=2530218 RepID=UPI00244DA240|nr:uncharacterized protein LOC129608534 [Condylostylus longicornis]XP_055376070.1 uncharacterized protein LOC129608534 [Condylostylus longicornis]